MAAALEREIQLYSVYLRCGLCFVAGYECGIKNEIVRVAHSRSAVAKCREQLSFARTTQMKTAELDKNCRSRDNGGHTA